MTENIKNTRELSDKTSASDPISLLRPRRKITGYSAILLPFDNRNNADWKGFEDHVIRTYEAGLIPAVNMDTGHVDRIDRNIQGEVLKRTSSLLKRERFTAGIFIGDNPGDRWNPDDYRQQIEKALESGAVPVIMQSYGLSSLPEKEIPDAYSEICRDVQEFIAFELGSMFAPFGKIYSIETYEQLIKIPNCIGAKHSSLSRAQEWERIALRDTLRPEFRVFTGNDLAIDMVMYGSDYLLGLSTFAPDLFALRDRFWEEGDNSFYELNDLLQYLGFFTFREPVPGYKHDAAYFLHLQNCLSYA